MIGMHNIWSAVIKVTDFWTLSVLLRATVVCVRCLFYCFYGSNSD